MDKQVIIEKTKEYVKNGMNNGESGHDWWHVYRVWRMAKKIGREEKADMFIVELTALLHDIADWKFHGEGTGSKITRKWLEYLNVSKKDIGRVVDIIDRMSFRGSAEKETIRTLEGKVVQDADRLDALGAIGVARAFTFAGHKKIPIHDPTSKPRKNMKFKDYKKSEAGAINHFYEKLLLLKDRMNTRTGKKMARQRHIFMKKYLSQFLKEWEGKM